MTWFPDKDPIPGDAQSVGQIEPVVVPRRRDIGPFAVRRATTRMTLLGGATMEGPRHTWWNVVSSSRERIEHAKEDRKLARFPAVPDESEVIPLPG